MRPSGGADAGGNCEGGGVGDKLDESDNNERAAWAAGTGIWFVAMFHWDKDKRFESSRGKSFQTVELCLHGLVSWVWSSKPGVDDSDYRAVDSQKKKVPEKILYLIAISSGGASQLNQDVLHLMPSTSPKDLD
ncbi:unnamed protein product [Rhizoctonia solani]|uniref:Uncharacterized protein n=1 Tax=Rhizoctonia solani TaxID=456999 RepID=A0A8H3HMC1_9AGAM|nr:unnamed protein product [Rhizoctonia solani]